MANNKGWIKLPRKIIDEPIWPKTRPYTRTEAWLRILIEVNYTDNEWIVGNQVVDCLRGQKLYSLQTWAKLFNWNRTKVKRYFETLEKLSYIETKVVHKTTQITICNFDDYQDERNDSGTIMEQKRNDSETILNTIKKGENIEKEKIDKYIPDFSVFKNLVDQVKKENKIEADDEFTTELFTYYETNDWAFFNGAKIKNEKHLKAVIKTSLKNANSPKNKNQNGKIILGEDLPSCFDKYKHNENLQ
jgi:DNA-binding transcriptional regulator YhcF (GntR family)